MKLSESFKALLPNCKARDDKGEDLMPDASTQTLSEWKFISDMTAATKPKSGKHHTSSNMDSIVWGDGWKILDKYYPPSEWEKQQQIRNDSGSEEAWKDGTTRRASLPAIEKVLEDQEMMDLPPTPGSGKSAYSEPNPSWKEPSILDEGTEDLFTAGEEDSNEKASVLVAEEFKTLDAVKSSNGANSVRTPTPVPVHPPVNFKLNNMPPRTQAAQTTAYSRFFKSINISSTPAPKGAQSSHVRAQVSAFQASANLQSESNSTDHGFCAGGQIFQIGRDPTFPQMLSGPSLEAHLPGVQQAEPLPPANFSYTAPSTGETDIDISPGICGWLKEFENLDSIDASKIEETHVELGLRTQTSRTNLRKLESGEGENIVTEPAQGQGNGWQAITAESGREQTVTATANVHSLKATTPPAKMPLKLPIRYHQAVLEGLIAEGATYEQQVAVMEGLREIERTADLSKLAEGIGVMEVDASEPTVASSIQPVVPPAPPLEKQGRGRKRKGESARGPVKKQRPANQIKALTNEEHFANGWAFRPRKHFDLQRLPEIREYIRSILACKRWWNGLTKSGTIDKIMEWQEDMQRLEAEKGAEEAEHNSEATQLVQEDAHDSDATIPVIDTDVTMEEGPSHTVSIASNHSSIKQSPFHAATAGQQNRQIISEMSKIPALLPETLAQQIDNTGCVCTSSVSLSSDHSIFFDPDAAPRHTPLMQKFQDAKVETTKEKAKLSNDSGDASVASSLKNMSPLKSVVATTHLAEHDVGGDEHGEDASVIGSRASSDVKEGTQGQEHDS